MSGLTLAAINTLGGSLTIPSTTNFQYDGFVRQFKSIQTSNRSTYSAAVSGNGTAVTDLNITITPKYATSLIILTWMINGESSYNVTWTAMKNGVLITDTGYEGYNNNIGNVRYSGLLTPTYDLNDSSTPYNLFLQYAVIAGSTASRTYAPAIRAAGGSAYTLYLNRTVASAGADNQEQTVSTGQAMEIYRR
jgi:hypothetical protein